MRPADAKEVRRLQALAARLVIELDGALIPELRELASYCRDASQDHGRRGSERMIFKQLATIIRRLYK